MGFDRAGDRHAAVRLAVLFLAGATAATGWTRGLYATAVLAVVVAAWVGAAQLLAARRRHAPRAAVPAPAGDDARARQRLAVYLDLSPAPLVALDAGDRLRAVNRAARRLFGADDMLRDPPPALVAAIAATVPGRTARVQIGTAQGLHRFAILTVDLATDGVPARVAALIDIDAELRAAEAQALHDLLQVLSHEITNTLTPIASLARTAAQMLAEPDADRQAVADAVATVARRAEGLQRFGEAYRAMARLPAPTIASVRIAPLVEDLARLFATRWPAAVLTLDLDAAPATVAADADQLSAALWALLQNAAEVADAVTVQVRATATTVELLIADNGPGIAGADRDAIFQPFFTTKPEGSGVGLALSRQIFRAHGGDLILIAPAPAQFVGSLPR